MFSLRLPIIPGHERSSLSSFSAPGANKLNLSKGSSNVSKGEIRSQLITMLELCRAITKSEVNSSSNSNPEKKGIENELRNYDF